jgi:integrase
MDPDSLSKSFRRLIASTKVTAITFHGLRHTHIRTYLKIA